jgi:hypothetical protein
MVFLNFLIVKSSLISKEIEEGIYNPLNWKHKTIKNRETYLPIPRKGWLEEANQMSASKSCMEVILKDCQNVTSY